MPGNRSVVSLNPILDDGAAAEVGSGSGAGGYRKRRVHLPSYIDRPLSVAIPMVSKSRFDRPMSHETLKEGRHDRRAAHRSPGGVTGVSWLCLLLPQIEQTALGDEVLPAAAAIAAGQNANRVLGRNRIAGFLCPSGIADRSTSTIDDITGFGNAYTTHYVGNMGPIGTNPATGLAYAANPSGQGLLACEGILPLHPTVISGNPAEPVGVRIGQVSDGTSKTLMLVETSWRGLETGSYRSWVRGVSWNNDATAVKNVQHARGVVAYNGGSNFNVISMGSNHPGGCTVATTDSSVRFVNQSIDLNRVLLPLASEPVNFGEVLLTPDGSRGNARPQGLAMISEGRYDTQGSWAPYTPAVATVANMAPPTTRLMVLDRMPLKGSPR